MVVEDLVGITEVAVFNEDGFEVAVVSKVGVARGNQCRGRHPHGVEVGQ